jgi:transcriptional regulator with XRE-family HTH domain
MGPEGACRAILMKEELSRLGFRIERERMLRGYSQNAFADKCGLDRSYLGAIERGDHDIEFGVLCTICEGLSCDIAGLTKDIPFTMDPSSASWDCWKKQKHNGSSAS